MAKATGAEFAQLANIAELIDSGGQIQVGQIYPIECAAVANDEHNCLAMLQRRRDETLWQLLCRLDDAIGRAWSEDFFTDEINPPSPSRR